MNSGLEHVHLHVLVRFTCALYVIDISAYLLASYPGRVGGERQPGIDCLRMRGRFHYISVKL